MSAARTLPLEGRVCLVTGASRGLGRGIALQLGEAGATVYITGRTLESKEGSKGSLAETAKEVESRGGKCRAIQCDHSKDGDIEKLFKVIAEEQNGRLDILINNAYSAVNHLMKNLGKKFWEQPYQAWDVVNNVGLRNHYVCSVLAAKMMVERKSGLIVNISSMGGINYLFSALYGIGKEACDRMAVDCAYELKSQNVAYISLWPGAAKTEELMDFCSRDDIPDVQLNDYMTSDTLRQNVLTGESTELAGKAVVALALDPNVMRKTGKIHMTCDLAQEYGFKDIDGQLPSNVRSLSVVGTIAGYSRVSSWIPSWIRIPKWTVWLSKSRF